MNKLPLFFLLLLIGTRCSNALDIDSDKFRDRIREFDKGLPPIGGYKGDPTDIEYLKCQTCPILVKEVVKRVNKLKKVMKGLHLSEFMLTESISRMCDTTKKEGKWISKYEIDESQEELVLRRHKKFGKCKSSCKTISLTCQMLLDSFRDDLTKVIFDEQEEPIINHLQKTFCTSRIATSEGECTDFIPRFPATRVKFDETFEVKTESDKFFDKLNSDLRRNLQQEL